GQRDGGRDEGRIGDRGELHEEDATVVLTSRQLGDAQAEARLAGAAGTGEGQETRAPQQLADSGHLSLATDEAGDLWRQVGRRFKRARRREVGRQARDQELEQALRTVEVLQPVFAELAQRGAGGEGAADERGRRGRKDDLAAVRSGRDSSGAVDVDGDVVVATQRAFASGE